MRILIKYIFRQNILKFKIVKIYFFKRQRLLSINQISVNPRYLYNFHLPKFNYIIYIRISHARNPCKIIFYTESIDFMFYVG